MCKVDGRLAMAVLRAADFLDLDKLAALAGTKHVALAAENEFAKTFAHIEPGAMPPFGQIYNQRTYVDSKLAAVDRMYFNGGTHKELLCIAWDDYRSLVHPEVADLVRCDGEVPHSTSTPHNTAELDA